ncbi:MAG: hypothetical protein K2I83_01920, partial [Bacteroidales bacterium]|nr:hypothetical protein [Bacteroidales bacterium]
RTRKGMGYVMTLVPAVFMTSVVFTYFFRAPECLGGVFAHHELYLNVLSYLAGAAATISIFCIFIRWANKTQRLPNAD